MRLPPLTESKNSVAGVWLARARQFDIDMAARAAEYGLFRVGIYPDARLEQPPASAGVCWALAMIKPQIALPFLVLFPLRRQMVGGFCGVAILAASTVAACYWTGVPLGTMFEHWGRGMSLRFLEQASTIGPGTFAKRLGIDHRTMHILALGVMAAVLVPVASLMRRTREAAMLTMVALCSVCGMICFYHRSYDTIMLFPTVLAALHTAAATPGRLTRATAAVMLGSVLIPMRLLLAAPRHEAVLAITWMTATAVSVSAAAIVRQRSGNMDGN